MKILLLCLLIALSVGTASPLRAQRTGKVYTELHPLLIDTLKFSRVEGVMTGDIANAFNSKLNLQGAVYVKSELIKKLPQPDCGQISVVFTKRGVTTPKGVTDANLRTQMNYCKDGSPPSTGKPL
jgi:hypothetical protein